MCLSIHRVSSNYWRGGGGGGDLRVQEFLSASPTYAQPCPWHTFKEPVRRWHNGSSNVALALKGQKSLVLISWGRHNNKHVNWNWTFLGGKLEGWVGRGGGESFPCAPPPPPPPLVDRTLIHVCVKCKEMGDESSHPLFDFALFTRRLLVRKHFFKLGTDFSNESVPVSWPMV